LSSRHQRSGAFIALSCVGAFSIAPAHADPAKTETPDPDQQRHPDDITVTGQRERRDADPKDVARLVDTPRSIVELTSEVIEQTGSVSLQDALRTVPGITFGAAEGGNPIGDRPFIRGFDSQGSIYVDGVRDIASSSREVFAVDSIQIVRGSDSTLGGRGSAGGTINIISKLPQLQDFASVSGSYGNADFRRISGDANLRLGAMAAVRVEAVYHDQDVAGRDAIFAKRWGVAPSIALGLGTPTRITAMYYHLESDELPDSGLPYAYTLANAPGTGNIRSEPALGRFTTMGGATGTIDRSTFYGLKNRDFRKTNTDQVMLRAEHDFGGVTLRNTARFTDSNQAYIYTQPDDSQGNVYGTTTINAPTAIGPLTSGGYVWRRANTRHSTTQTLIDQTDLYGLFRTGSIQHSFSVGTEFAWEKSRRGTFVVAAGSTIVPRCTTASVARYYCTSLFAPNQNDPFVNYTSDTSTTATPIVRSPITSETQNDGNTRAVYGFDSIMLIPQLILNLGARYDRFASTATTYPTTTTQLRLSRTDNLFNWQAGLVFKPTTETSVYASYATAATPPNSLLGEGREDNALPTTGTAVNLAILDQLKAQKTKSYEVGAKASLVGGRLQLGAAAFQTKISNTRVQIDPQTVQFIGESRIRGVELTASGTILPGWTVFGGYSHLDAKIIDGGTGTLTAPAVGTRVAQVVYVPSVNTGKRLPQVARDSVTGTTNVTLFGRLQIGGTAIYQSRVFGGYQDNRSAVQTAAGVVTINPATKVIYRSTPGYWRFDARAAIELTPNLSLAVNAQNLTDKEYFSQTFTTHYATLAPGRTVFGTVNVKF
jgi:catecholate siderophore receptor